MRVLDKELKNRKFISRSLLEYGFKEVDCVFYYTAFLDEEFKIIVEIKDNIMTSKIIDIEDKEEYVLVDISNARGEFIGKLKEKYDEKLQDIIVRCSEPDVFKTMQAKQVIQYVKEKYNDELEYLWKKFPENAIVRHKDSKKWYLALLIVSKRKLGLDDDAVVEIIDLKLPKEEIERLVDNHRFFPGYHMNKKTWFTIVLDGSVSIEQIFKYIDISYKQN